MRAYFQVKPTAPSQNDKRHIRDIQPALITGGLVYDSTRCMVRAALFTTAKSYKNCSLYGITQLHWSFV